MESETTIIHPLHFMVVQRAGTSWIFSGERQVILNPRHVPVLFSFTQRTGSVSPTAKNLLQEQKSVLNYH
jgi:hypothetical protein